MKTTGKQWWHARGSTRLLQIAGWHSDKSIYFCAGTKMSTRYKIKTGSLVKWNDQTLHTSVKKTSTRAVLVSLRRTRLKVKRCNYAAFCFQCSIKKTFTLAAGGKHLWRSATEHTVHLSLLLLSRACTARLLVLFANDMDINSKTKKSVWDIMWTRHDSSQVDLEKMWTFFSLWKLHRSWRMKVSVGRRTSFEWSIPDRPHRGSLDRGPFVRSSKPKHHEGGGLSDGNHCPQENHCTKF